MSVCVPEEINQSGVEAHLVTVGICKEQDEDDVVVPPVFVKVLLDWPW